MKTPEYRAGYNDGIVGEPAQWRYIGSRAYHKGHLDGFRVALGFRPSRAWWCFWRVL